MCDDEHLSHIEGRHFGSSSLIVRSSSQQELLEIALIDVGQYFDQLNFHEIKFDLIITDKT